MKTTTEGSRIEESVSVTPSLHRKAATDVRLAALQRRTMYHPSTLVRVTIAVKMTECLIMKVKMTTSMRRSDGSSSESSNKTKHKKKRTFSTKQ